MKIIITLIFCVLITITTIFSQSNENLNSDQKKKYNRKKLTVEKISETSGGMGWYWGFFSKKVETWRAFKGLANQIEAEEFFRITGYVEEADKVKMNLEDANSKITLGVGLYIGGVVVSVIPKTEKDDIGYGYSVETVTYPYFIPGTIAWATGIYFWYNGMLKKLKPVAPYQTAADIADEYNKKLMEEITQ